MIVLRSYVENEHTVMEYSRDGLTISHIERVPIQIKSDDMVIQPSLEQRVEAIEEAINLILNL